MKILCATDLLPESDAAVERAVIIARQLRAQCYLVHIVGSVQDERTAHTALVQIGTRLGCSMEGDGIAVSVLLQVGNTATQLIGVVRQIAPDLVVLGPRHRRFWYDRFSEPLAQKILSVRQCPVLIVKHVPTETYRDILLALDLSPTAGEIIRTTESIVWASGARTSVVHAFEPDYGPLPYIPKALESMGAANSPEKANALRAVRHLLRENSSSLIDCNLILSVAFPAEAVLGTIECLRPDLLVMGTGGYGRFRRALLGSTASRVLEAAPCDVLVVPQGSTRQIVGRSTAAPSDQRPGMSACGL
jgi:universal stress protein E